MELPSKHDRDPNALLESQLAGVESGGSRLVILLGESGIGKTWTVRRFLAEHEDLPVLSARADPRCQASLHPLYSAIEQYLASHAQLVQGLLSVLRRWLPILPGFGARLEAVVQEPLFRSRVEKLVSHGQDEMSSFGGMLELLGGLIGNRVAVFWIDDFQWSDPATISFMLSYLPGRLDKRRFLWILSANPMGPSIQDAPSLRAALSRIHQDDQADRVSVLTLERVPQVECSELIKQILCFPHRFTAEDVEALWQRSQGVPRYLRALLTHLQETKRIHRHAGAFEPTSSIAALDLPESLRKAIQERLRSIYHSFRGSRMVLEAASAIGDVFCADAIEAVTRLGEANQVLVDLDEKTAVVRDLLVENHWEFDHTTTRECVYEILGSGARRVHIALAEHFEQNGEEDPSRIAYHFRAGGELARAFHHELRHARRLLGDGYYTRSLAAFEKLSRTIDEGLSDPALDLLAFGYDHALARYYCGQYDGCLRTLGDLAASHMGLAGDFGTRIQLLTAKCLNKSNRRGDFLRASALLEAQLGATPESETGSRARLLSELVVSQLHLNNSSDAARTQAEAERLFTLIGDILERCSLARRCAALYEPELSLPILRRCVIELEKTGAYPEVVRLLTNLATVELDLGRIDDAERTLDRAALHAEMLGGYGLDYIWNNRGLCNARRREGRAARSAFGAALGKSVRPVCALIIRANDAAMRLAMEDPGLPRLDLERLLEEAGATGEAVYRVPIAVNLALALAFEGMTKEARAKLNEILSWVLGEWPSTGIRQRVEKIGCNLAALPPGMRYGAPDMADDLCLIDMQFWGE